MPGLRSKLLPVTQQETCERLKGKLDEKLRQLILRDEEAFKMMKGYFLNRKNAMRDVNHMAFVYDGFCLIRRSRGEAL